MLVTGPPTMPQQPKPILRLITSPGEPVRTTRTAALQAVAMLAEPDPFDRLLDEEARRASRLHWTPAEVCERAAALLALEPAERVLDVGSGVGKLCLLGAKVSRGGWVGVEQREQLVTQARALAVRLGSSAEFLHRDCFELEWSDYQALYFYNPFDEARFPPALQIDGALSSGASGFAQRVAATQAKLSALPPGTRVLTFHGFGGPMPAGYQLLEREPIGDGELELWLRSEGERRRG